MDEKDALQSKIDLVAQHCDKKLLVALAERLDAETLATLLDIMIEVSYIQPKSAPPAQYSFGMSLGKTDPLTQEIFERLMRTFPSRDNGGASPDQDEE